MKMPIKGLISFVENLVAALLDVQEVAISTSKVDLKRTISINDCCVSTTDFSITPGSETYKKLEESGRIATRNYMENYINPISAMSKADKEA